MTLLSDQATATCLGNPEPVLGGSINPAEYILTGLGLTSMICRSTSLLDMPLLSDQATATCLGNPEPVLGGSINPAESLKLPFTLQGIN